MQKIFSLENTDWNMRTSGNIVIPLDGFFLISSRMHLGERRLNGWERLISVLNTRSFPGWMWTAAQVHCCSQRSWWDGTVSVGVRAGDVNYNIQRCLKKIGVDDAGSPNITCKTMVLLFWISRTFISILFSPVLTYLQRKWTAERAGGRPPRCWGSPLAAALGKQLCRLAWRGGQPPHSSHPAGLPLLPGAPLARAGTAGGRRPSPRAGGHGTGPAEMGTGRPWEGEPVGRPGLKGGMATQQKGVWRRGDPLPRIQHCHGSARAVANVLLGCFRRCTKGPFSSSGTATSEAAS